MMADNSMNKMKPGNCPECLENFVYKDFINKKKQPLLIGCGHSICESCIRSALSAKKDIVCKFCSYRKEFEPEMVEDLMSYFPIDQFTVGRLIKASAIDCEIQLRSVDFRKNVNRKLQKSTIKEKCAECCIKFAEVKCKQCIATYCSACFQEVHSLSRTLRTHENLKLATDVSSRTVIEITSCSVHAEKQDFYCRTCSKQLCSRCGVIDHGQHEVVLLADQNKLKKKSVDEALDKAFRIHKRLIFTRKKAYASLRSSSSDGPSTVDCSQLKNEIAMHFQQLHGLLQIRETHLLDNVKKFENEQVSSLNSVIDELTTYLQETEEVLNEAGQAMKPESFRLIDANSILSSLQEVCATPCFLLLDEEADADAESSDQVNSHDKCDRIKFVFDNKLSDMLKEYGAVRAPPRKKYVLKSEENLPADYTADPVPDEIKNQPFPLDNEYANSVEEGGDGSVKSVDNECSSRQRRYASDSDQSTASSTVNVLSVFHGNRKRKDTQSNAAASLDRQMPMMMPKIVNTRRVDLAPGTVEEVKICHIVSPSLFFTHRKKANQYLDKISRSIMKVVNTRSTPKEVKQGWIYLVKFSSDGKWYRGRVIQTVSESLVRVHFIDFGNEDVCRLESFRLSTDRITDIQPLANQCSLYNCHPNPGPEWCQEAIKMMASMCNNSNVIRMHVVNNRENGPLEVDLRCYLNGSSSLLRDSLIFHSFATYASAQQHSQLQSIIHQTHYNPSKRVFNTGNSLDAIITHVKDPSNFYINTEVQFYRNQMYELNSFYNHPSQAESKVYYPSIDMAVAAYDQHDRSWYRAKITKHVGNQNVELYYVDTGKTGTVNWADLKVLENKFLRVSYMATKCELFNVQPKNRKSGWPHDATEAFKKMVLYQLARVHVAEQKDAGLAVVLYRSLGQDQAESCINGLLIEQAHAASTTLISPFVHNEPRKKALLPTPSTKAPGFEQLVKQATYKPRRVRNYKQQGSFSPASTIALARMTPEREKDEEKEEESDDQQKLENKRFPCTVIKVINPSNFYIMFDANRWEKIKKEITEFYSVEENREKYKRTEDWKEGDTCAFLNSDSIWYRAIVSTILPDNKAKLLVKDIAEEVTVATCKLYNLNEEFKAILDISVRCHLCDLVAPGGSGVWPSISTEEFQDHVKSRKVYFMQKGEVDVERKSVPAELWLRSIVREPGPLEPAVNLWYTVNHFLAEKGLALSLANSPSADRFQSSLLKSMMTNKKPPSTENKKDQDQEEVVEEEEEVVEEEEVAKQCEKSESEESSLRSMVAIAKKKKGSSKNKEPYVCPDIKEWPPALPLQSLKFRTTATYVDYECNVFIQDIDSADTLGVIERSLTSKYKNSKPSAHDSFWSVGQLCIVQYHADQKWYRGRVVQVLQASNSYKVAMVDYGNVETCKAFDLRKNLLMTQVPIQCHRCTFKRLKPISEDGKWNEETLDYIHSSIVGRMCDFELTGSVGNYSVVEVEVIPGQFLSELLISLNYATLVDNENDNDSTSSSYSSSCGDVDDDDDDVDVIKKTIVAETSRIESDGIASDEQTVTDDNEQQNQLEMFEAIAAPSVVENPKPMPTLKKHSPSPPLQQRASWLKMMEEEQNLTELKSKLVNETKQKGKKANRFRSIELRPEVEEFEMSVSSILSETTMFSMINETETVKTMKSEFIDMMEEMQEIAPNLSPIKHPKGKQFCCAKYREDEKWYRGEILKVQDDVCTVKFVDYGNIDLVKINDIHHVKPEWFEIPIQGLPVTLYNLRMAPDSNILQCADALEYLLDMPVTAKIMSHDPLVVELFKDGKSINQELSTKPCFTSIE